MKRIFMCLLTLVALCGLLGVTASAAETATVQVTGVLDYVMAEEVFSQLNNYRASNGLSKLVLDERLTAAAMERAVESSIAFSHTRPNGTACNTAFPFSGTWAENLAAGQRNASAAMTSWKNSSGHNKNMLNTKVTHVGIGCAYVDGQYYWAQVFMNKGSDNTSDYRNTRGRFLYSIEVLKSSLTPPSFYPSLKVIANPRENEAVNNSFTLTYSFKHADGTNRPTLIPTIFALNNGSVADYIMRDEEGNDFARLSLATDGTSEIIVTPIAENGTATVSLSAYAGDPNPITATITLHTHNLHATVFEPTCQKRGYTFFSCPGCQQFTDNYVDEVDCVAAEERAYVREATCSRQGYSGDIVCKWCRRIMEEGEWYFGEHNSSDWIIQFEPTETEEGLKYKYCLDCRSITASEAIPKIGEEVFAGSFRDVNSADYFYDPVLWAVDAGITKGTSDTTFAPLDPCTRAHVVTFLWRAAGSPAPETDSNPFTDVPEGQWYSDAVLWAVEKGITTGTSATTFAPNDPCTRAHVVTFLWRYFEQPDSWSSNPFFDVLYGEYFYEPVLWAVDEGITNGTSEYFFSPYDTCTRGQIVTFLYRAMAK